MGDIWNYFASAIARLHGPRDAVGQQMETRLTLLDRLGVHAEKLIAYQLASVESIDSKTNYVLAFNGILAGLLLANASDRWWIVRILVISSAGCIVTSVTLALRTLSVRIYEAGFDVIDFYREYYDKDRLVAAEQSLAQLHDRVNTNWTAIANKARCFQWALRFFALAIALVLLAGLVKGGDIPWLIRSAPQARRPNPT